MIKQTIHILIANKKYMAGIFALYFIMLITLIYQEQNTLESEKARAHCLLWLQEQKDPIESLDMQIDKLITNNTIVFTSSTYTEYMLLTSVRDYVEEKSKYSVYVDHLLESQEIAISFFSLPEKAIAKHQATYEQYSSLKGLEVYYGNYVAWEKYFSFGIVEVTLLLLMIYTIYYLVILEREKGLSSFVYSTANGGKKYFTVKLATISIVIFTLYVILYSGKWVLFSKLYGSNGVGEPIQSLAGYQESPYKLSIFQYAIVAAIWNYSFTWLLGLIMLVIASLPITETGFTIVVGGGLAICWYSGARINSNSPYIILRDISPLKLWDVEYWFQSFHYVYIGKIKDFILHMKGIIFPITAFCMESALFYYIGRYLYSKGMKPSGRKDKGITKVWKYKGGLMFNEIEFILLQKKVLLIMMALLFFVIATTDFQKRNHTLVQLEKQIVQTLNEKQEKEADTWITNKKAELQQLEQELNELEIQRMKQEITTEQYEKISSNIMNQLVIKPIIEQLYEQGIHSKDGVSEEEVHRKYEYNSLSGQIYGDSGKSMRVMCSIIITIFMILVVLPMFPSDKQLGINRLIGSMPNCDQMIRTRGILLAGLVGGFSVLIYGIWILSIKFQFDLVGFNTPMQSWSYYRESMLQVTVGTAVIINVIWNSVIWAVIAYISMGISLYVTNIIWIQLIGVIVFLAPLTLELIGVGWVRKLSYYTVMIFGEYDLFRIGWKSIGLIVMIIVGIGIVKIGKNRWIQ